MIWVCIAIVLMALVVLMWCACAINPREPWEDEHQIKYTDDWIREKTK